MIDPSLFREPEEWGLWDALIAGWRFALECRVIGYAEFRAHISYLGVPDIG